MRIHAVAFTDHTTGWALEPTELNQDLTLFVGVSGVGKTKILRAIDEIARLAKGQPLSAPVMSARKPASSLMREWWISFENQGKQYQWSGQTEASQNENGSLEQNNKEYFLNEKLESEGRILLQRENDAVTFNQARLPKIRNDVSLISLCKEEELIAPVFDGFSKVYFEPEIEPGIHRGGDIKQSKDRFKSLDSLKQSHLPAEHKLIVAYYYFQEVFKKIVTDFRRIFDSVEDIKFDTVTRRIPGIDLHVLSIRERGSDLPIPSAHLSKGMLRTLFF
jgi:hypothetical protein